LILSLKRFALGLGVQAEAAKECFDLVLADTILTKRLATFEAQVHLKVYKLPAALALVVHEGSLKGG
jgi:hypothetical protein